jgi:drug/metabolite transporter (DMT)-like permease
LGLIYPVLYLLLVSFIWPFSFGLIKNQLTGLDSTAMSVVRIAFCLLIFLPLLRARCISRRQIAQLLMIGAIEFGVMYLLYMRSFVYLKAYEVALFTITTPLYVALCDALLRRRFERRHWLAATLSVGAALVIVWRQASSPGLWHGLLILQLSNLCFAIGQLAYRRIQETMTGTKDSQIFAWLYLGAFAATAATSLATGAWLHFQPTPTQWAVLAYLGILSSGLAFFWWNRGALRVNAGTLAAMNNAKIPLGVACSLWFFHEHADLPRLLVGGVCLGLAVWIAESGAQRLSA